MFDFRRKTVLVLLVYVAFAIMLPCSAVAADMVNINTATLEELMTLDRVGEKYAQRIIDYREKMGPFKTPEDIMKVKGIGKKTFEANRDRIVV